MMQRTLVSGVIKFLRYVIDTFGLIDAVILIIDEAYISDNREMREGAD